MANVFSKSDWAYTKEANSIRFDDFECVSKQYSHPKTIFYRTGDMFDSIGIEYENGLIIKHGGDGGGRTQRFDLAEDEYVIKMDIYYRVFLEGITFYTNKGRIHNAGHMCYSKKTIDFNGDGLACFYGASASMFGLTPSDHCLTGLGAYTKSISRKNIYSHILLEGIETDSRWDDILGYYDIYKSETILPKSIQIWSGQFLDKIQVGYPGIKMEAHGINEPGWEKTFEFSPGEYIIKVFGEANPISPQGNLCQIGKLAFKTNLGKTYEFNSWSSYKGHPFSFELPKGAALVAIGGRFGGGINIISGLVIHYVYLDGIDKTEFQICKDTVSQNSFKSVIYKTLSNGSKQSSNVWVNIIEDIEIQEDYDLLCASISNDENDVNFPDGVYAEMFSPCGKLFLKEDNMEHVHVFNDSFYQMSVVKPKKGKYRMLVRFRTDANLFVEYQYIIKNCDNILLAQSIPYKEENKLPLYGRPLQRLLIVNAAGPQALTATCSLQAIHIPYMISHFAYLHPFITMSFVVVGGLVLIYSFSKYHNKDAEKITIKSKVKETMKDEACWSVTRKNDRDIYQSLSNDEDFSQFAKVSVEKETNDFKNTLALYHRLLDKNNYNLHASKMKRITREDLQGKKLVVDIGGEGFVRDIGIRVAGVIHALNLNGHVRNNVTGFPIPFLIKINDWDTEDFPFEDGIVDAFIMQATPPPTLKTANEIIRCMNKETGRVDLILNELNNEIMMCYQYIRNGLGFKLYQGEEMVRKEYPHLVGSEYLTIYSSKYKPPRLPEISIL